MRQLHNSQFLVCVSRDKLGTFRENGLIGRPCVMGTWYVTSFIFAVPFNAISNKSDVAVAYFQTKQKYIAPVEHFRII